MQNYQILDWDTQILGIPTAKILPSRLTVEKLNEILQDLKKQKINLVYWASDSSDNSSQRAAADLQGLLTDRKITYCMDLHNFSQSQVDLSEVESYREQLPNKELKQLAMSIAVLSRFSNDPKISYSQLDKVYTTWLENSTRRKIAQEVLVIKKHEKIIGMTTLGEKNSRGDIGLLAVDPEYRGQQIGVRLVSASQQWCIENGYKLAQVVTQKDNVAACKLYEKCGYTIDTIEYFYHFWI